jgi:putative CocE/NonD family hydrolase
MADSWFHFTRALDGIDGAVEEMEALAEEGMEFAVAAVPATPVDGPDGPALRDAAVREHQASADMRGAVARTPFKDDETPGWSWTARSSFARREATERAGVPMLTAAGWFDAGTAAGALDRFVTLDVPQEAYVGAWNHGATFTTDPFAPPDQRSSFEERELLERVRDFFDRYVQRGEEPRPGRTLHYYTLARGDWRTTSTWPLPGTTTERWFMRAGGGLARGAPLDLDAADRFRPDPLASTGAASRWGTQVSGGGNVVYPDRAAADRRLLTWTSPPLERDRHVAGTVVVELQLSATRADGTLVAYLEEVAPDGRVTHVTEGHLRLACRALAAENPPHRALRTPRTFARADARPLLPGVVEAVRFDLLPTSVLLRAGHRLRIALGGTDAAHFELLPADGDVEYAVHREAARPSFVELPVAPA